MIVYRPSSQQGWFPWTSDQVWPVAVGEVHLRIISKAILACISRDVASAVSAHQLCVSIPAACEAAVQAVQQQYDSDETEVILLIN